MRALRHHRWDLTPRAAAALQQRMRKKLVLRGGPRKIRLVAGADVAYSRDRLLCVAAVVAVEVPSLAVVESATAMAPVKFPYVPGLLSFREGPALLQAFARLRSRPQVLFFDGHGTAHPRGFGLACHMGYLLDMPSVGCAKSLLVGDFEPPAEAVGSFSWLRYKGERIGAVLRTRASVRPIFISPGFRVGFRDALRLTMAVSAGFRIPEPTRQADILVERTKRENGL